MILLGRVVRMLHWPLRRVGRANATVTGPSALLGGGRDAGAARTGPRKAARAVLGDVGGQRGNSERFAWPSLAMAPQAIG